MAKAGPRGSGGRSVDARAALIAGAIEALQAVGFAGASAREIAQRAGRSQALIFYHFGSVAELLLAALDDVSDRRLASYREALDRAGSLTELIDAARAIFVEDLDAGHVTVLVEMIVGAQSVPGLGEQVAARLRPWRDFAEIAVRKATSGSPMRRLAPVPELAHGVVAGFLGLELLANLDGDRAPALALFDRARQITGLLDLVGVTVARPTRREKQRDGKKRQH